MIDLLIAGIIATTDTAPPVVPSPIYLTSHTYITPGDLGNEPPVMVTMPKPPKKPFRQKHPKIYKKVIDTAKVAKLFAPIVEVAGACAQIMVLFFGKGGL